MAVEVILGSNYTFSALFVDEFNVPLTVNAPRITIFSFSSTGTKTTHVNLAAMTAVPGEVGRYYYVFTAGVGLGDHTAVHAEMEGTDPQNPAVRLLVEEMFQTIAPTIPVEDSLLRATFIKA